ncbi:MAG: Phosphoenolpyruvate synthase [Candidatus Magasanikbacteria bacterium GW2011_GWA2_56_11]|uniref:Phosphoenolpyruvate synthase n=1 Tax=Candidatus Magasanikbacteria bacterium GW2011_GWA2_56_11 TaxID=1619044 RepID=A0A0G2B9V2_9BACT|nr:MAG: Phosphoenolpyruvate synthase [Candidatus Magasanikbacteria bacterium GW2011_GWA2_56_11]
MRFSRDFSRARSDGLSAIDTNTAMSLIIKGTGASRGRARGPVKIITGIADAGKFQDGDILVTRITSPAMVAMMARAAAIVCDVGSVTSHPSVVSRELGIPCVVNTREATARLQDGLVVEVDGSEGEVRVISREPEGAKNPAVSALNLDSEIDTWLDIAVEAVSAMDFSTFEDVVAWYRYDPLAARPWLEHVRRIVRQCRVERLTAMEAARLLPNPSEIRGTMIFDLYATKYAGLSKAERLEIFDFYRRMLRALCLDDPYAREKNVIHSKEKIRELAAAADPATPPIARALGRLVSAGYHVGHALYSDMHPSIVYDNYAPYDVSDLYGPRSVAVIKEFNNLNCPEIWPELKPVPADSVRIVCVYENVLARVDTVSHIVYDGDTVNGLKYAAVYVDGQKRDPLSLSGLSAGLEQAAIDAFTRWQGFDLEERKRRYYLAKAYDFKNLAGKLGLDWKPGEELSAAVRGKPLCRVEWPVEKAAVKYRLRSILDPRIEPAAGLL